MTWKTKGFGGLAAVLLAVVFTTGCPSDEELISSGNVVATLPATAVNPSQIDYECIRIDYKSMKIRPADGTCSADSDRPGEPCGADRDCTDAAVECTPFATICVGGLQDGDSCVIGDVDETCEEAGGVCTERGECFTLGGMFTGQECFSTAECDLGSGERCGGSCSAGSPIAGRPCVSDNDCTTSECVGGLADDAIESNDIILISETEELTGYFTAECPRCEFDRNPVRFCESDLDCENMCVPGDSIPSFCPVGLNCCTKFTNPGDVVTPICSDEMPCPTNRCVDTSESLPNSVLPESRYRITSLVLGNLLMFAPDAVREITSCSFGPDITQQYTDDPLGFTVGPNRTNAIRSVLDVTKLQDLLGTGPVANCPDAQNNFDLWFGITSD